MGKHEEDDGLRKKGAYKLFQAYWHDKTPPFEFHFLRDRWRKVYDKAAEMFGADNARLQSENAALREALKPFADAADKTLSEDKDQYYIYYEDCSLYITIGHLRKARALAAGGK